jgi:hypothetical protein
MRFVTCREVFVCPWPYSCRGLITWRGKGRRSRFSLSPLESPLPFRLFHMGVEGSGMKGGTRASFKMHTYSAYASRVPAVAINRIAEQDPPVMSINPVAEQAELVKYRLLEKTTKLQKKEKNHEVGSQDNLQQAVRNTASSEYALAKDLASRSCQAGRHMPAFL